MVGGFFRGLMSASGIMGSKLGPVVNPAASAAGSFFNSLGYKAYGAYASSGVDPMLGSLGYRAYGSYAGIHSRVGAGVDSLRYKAFGAYAEADAAVRGIPGKAEELKDTFANLSPDDFMGYKIHDWFDANTNPALRQHWKKGVGAGIGVTAAVWTTNRLDRGVGYLYGGPGYGGYLGYGEGTHSERNALQGATANMNYQAQMMGLQALSSNQVAPQYSLTIAPMRQRRASTALRDSTQGLALGLHKGRHGGY